MAPGPPPVNPTGMPLDNRSISRDKGGQWGATHPKFDPYPPPDADHFASLTHANLPFRWRPAPARVPLPVASTASLTFGAQHDRADLRLHNVNAGGLSKQLGNTPESGDRGVGRGWKIPSPRGSGGGTTGLLPLRWERRRAADRGRSLHQGPDWRRSESGRSPTVPGKRYSPHACPSMPRDRPRYLPAANVASLIRVTMAS